PRVPLGHRVLVARIEARGVSKRRGCESHPSRPQPSSHVAPVRAPRANSCNDQRSRVYHEDGTHLTATTRTVQSSPTLFWPEMVARWRQSSCLEVVSCLA